MTVLMIATRNAHKVQEIRQILPPEFTYLTLHDFPGAPEVVEDVDTFEGNACKKALTLGTWLAGNPEMLFSKIAPGEVVFYVLADDSGLEVDALNGQPGVYSARFASMDVGAPGNSPDAANNAKLLRLMAAVPMEKRTARFRCALAACRLVISPLTRKVLVTGQQTQWADGRCEGRIAFAPAGKSGFGYDPLFIPEGRTQSFAELGETIKNTLSHRARALEKIRGRLK